MDHHAIQNLPKTTLSDLKILGGTWTIYFQKNLGAPEKITTDSLKSYTESSDPGVKYFGGTAVYTNHFKLSKKELKQITKHSLFKSPIINNDALVNEYIKDPEAFLNKYKNLLTTKDYLLKELKFPNNNSTKELIESIDEIKDQIIDEGHGATDEAIFQAFTAMLEYIGYKDLQLVAAYDNVAKKMVYYLEKKIGGKWYIFDLQKDFNQIKDNLNNWANYNLEPLEQKPSNWIFEFKNQDNTEITQTDVEDKILLKEKKYPRGDYANVTHLLKEMNRIKNVN